MSSTILNSAEGVTLPPTADELPCDDGVPMETQVHDLQRHLLIESLEELWADRNDFYAGGNMFLYFSLSQVKNNDFRGPDVFVVLGTNRRLRKSWVVWEEGGKVPEVVIELLSESTAERDRGEKKRIYERILRVPEYVLFDPLSAELEAYRLGEATSGYHPIPREASGRLPIVSLGLELGIWAGAYQRYESRWLRWFTPEGGLVATAAERAGQAEERAGEATRKADDLARRLAEYEQRFGRLG